MATVEERIETPVGPERLNGQGLDASQQESGERAIRLLLTDPVVGPQTDWMATYRDGAYEVWAARGMVRFQRFLSPAAGYEYRIVEQIGANPIEEQDARALSTIDEEIEAARASGRDVDHPDRAYVEPEHLTYPLAYERISQLFDSPNAPDLVVNPKTYAFGRQPGQHGACDVIQSRCPLVFSGPGVQPGVSEALARQVDVAPTIARLMGFPKVDGRDITGRKASERGVDPDVYLRRQDGRVLEETLETGPDGRLQAKPERVYLLLLDGLSNSELLWRLSPGANSPLAEENDAPGIPNLRRLIERGVTFRHGSVATFPTITWPSHNTIGTGAWSGHHDIVNPTYYLRGKRQVVTPQGQQFETARFLDEGVETLFEAFHRVLGPWRGRSGAFTASIHEPCTRGADHATLERRLVGDREALKTLNPVVEVTPSPLFAEHQASAREALVDNRGIAQAVQLFTDESHPPPLFLFHEIVLLDGVGHDFGPHSPALRAALEETDRRLGHVLHTLEERGLFESTLFVVTTDHGMAPTDASLAANQAELLPREGMKAVVPAPMVYLIDLDVAVEPAADGRTVTVTVLANDPDETGERPPVAGAAVTASAHGRTLARGKTDSYGVAGLPLPVDLSPHDVVLSIHHDDFNPRHLRLDGSNVLEDLREFLYEGLRP